MKVILGLIVAGVVLAVVIGVAGASQTVGERQFCKSLSYFDSAVQSLTTSSSPDDFEKDAENVRNGWNDIQEKASSLSGVDMHPLNEAYAGFEQAVQSVPGNASVAQSDHAIAGSATSLQAAVASTMKSVGCS